MDARTGPRSVKRCCPAIQRSIPVNPTSATPKTGARPRKRREHQQPQAARPRTLPVPGDRSKTAGLGKVRSTTDRPRPARRPTPLNLQVVFGGVRATAQGRDAARMTQQWAFAGIVAAIVSEDTGDRERVQGPAHRRRESPSCLGLRACQRQFQCQQDHERGHQRQRGKPGQ